MLVILDLGYELLEVGIGSVLPSSNPDGDEPLLGEVVPQDVGRVRETLQKKKGDVLSLVPSSCRMRIGSCANCSAFHRLQYGKTREPHVGAIRIERWENSEPASNLCLPDSTTHDLIFQALPLLYTVETVTV